MKKSKCNSIAPNQGHSLCYNVYERNQQERFKAYMFVTEPNKSKLGDNISN